MARALPPRCQPQCDACELHPGYMNNFREACRLKPRACDSAVCPPPQPRVPKRLRRLNFSGYHVRSFKVSSAFASLAELSLANVSAARVLSLEGYPGIFQTPPRHARAWAQCDRLLATFSLLARQWQAWIARWEQPPIEAARCTVAGRGAGEM